MNFRPTLQVPELKEEISEMIIQTRNLCKSYGTFLAVDHLNLNVYSGDVYGFLGPNGAGKSTTIRMILSLITPESGDITLFGKALAGNRNDILSRIGSIVEKPDFYKFLSARKNIELLASMSGKEVKRTRISEIFELVGLKGREDDPAKTYSHGMKQRLGLAQALVHDPELIILDEPTTGLDPQGIIDIRNLISHLSKDLKKTIFLSSHILSEMELIATRMVIMNKGKALVEGHVADLLNASELVVTFTVDNLETAMTCVSTSGWKARLREVSGNQLVFLIASSEVATLNNHLCEGGTLVTGIDSKRKLEDYFLQLLTKNGTV